MKFDTSIATAFFLTSLSVHNTIAVRPHDDNQRGSDSYLPSHHDGLRGSSSLATGGTQTLVDYLYTYGAPSVTRPAISNPGNKCIPGIRTFTEDVSNVWGWEHITNTDFAAQWNADGRPHPKMNTLVLRWVDNSYVEYFFMPCADSDGTVEYPFQWWPGKNVLARIGHDYGDIHGLGDAYYNRLTSVPANDRGPLLEYTSAAHCVYMSSQEAARDCLNGDSDWSLPAWDVIAFAVKQTDWLVGLTDYDKTLVVANDSTPGFRKCIISFTGSDKFDLLNNLGGDNAGSTGYCGHENVQIGVRNELWHITHDTQYQQTIKPALETCHEVTCVGHSLGGSLCDLFTMCANTQATLTAGMADDYQSLAWTKPVASTTTSKK